MHIDPLQNQHACVLKCRDRRLVGDQMVCDHNGATIQENAAADECPHPKGRKFASRGIGDTAAKIIQKVTGKAPCGGCAKRRDLLNKAIPYER